MQGEYIEAPHIAVLRILFFYDIILMHIGVSRVTL